MSENKSDSHPYSTQEINPQPDTQVNTSRRRLTGAGLGMSAIFTLASRPVLAAQCATPSAAASGNLSHHGTPVVCLGRTPGFWKQSNHSREWPARYVQGTCSGLNGSCNSSPQSWTGGTLFHNVFGAGGVKKGSSFKVRGVSLSLNQIMVMNDSSYPGLSDPDNLCSHLVAALLNAASGRTNGVLSVATVLGIWNEWLSKDYFEPTAGVSWKSAQIVAYLKTTMD